jgi:hypothetical protein
MYAGVPSEVPCSVKRVSAERRSGDAAALIPKSTTTTRSASP